MDRYEIAEVLQDLAARYQGDGSPEWNALRNAVAVLRTCECPASYFHSHGVS